MSPEGHRFTGAGRAAGAPDSHAHLLEALDAILPDQLHRSAGVAGGLDRITELLEQMAVSRQTVEHELRIRLVGRGQRDPAPRHRG